MGAGEVTQFPHLKRMPLCVHKCCSQAQCHVAYVIREVCYTVSCFSRDLCRTRPLEGADVTSEITYVTRDGLTMFSHDDEASVASEGLATEAALTSTASERTLGNSTVQSTGSSGHCRAQSALDNVRLLGDLNAGTFTDRGLVPSVDQCSAVCCASGSCDLAYVVGQRCYSVTCYSVELCQAVAVRPMAFNPTIVFVTRDASNKSGESAVLSLHDKNYLQKQKIWSKFDAKAIIARMTPKQNPTVLSAMIGRLVIGSISTLIGCYRPTELQNSCE